MNVFITGASGYIGGAVARELQKKGHNIIALARTNSTAKALQAKGYTAILGDLLQPDKWQKQAAQANVFIHCAQVRLGKRIGKRWLQQAAHADRVAFTGIVEAATRSSHCTAIIYTSGISVVGDYGSEWTDENTPLKPSTTVGSYHVQGEQLAREAHSRGLPVVVIRPSLPVSAAGTFSDFFLAQAAQGKLRYIGNGQNFCPTVHLEDLAQAYVLAVENPPVGETLIVSDNNPLTMEDFSNALTQQFGKGKAKSAPKWLVSVLAGKPLANLLSSSFRVKNDKAKKLLGWKPHHPTFYDALAQVLQQSDATLHRSGKA